MRTVAKWLALAATVVFSGTITAHTISIGYANSGPGSVTFWFGTYHDCTEPPPTEGSFNLVGINGTPFASTTVPFALTTAIKPSGLVDGTTNFYATDAGPLAPTDVDILGPVLCWQGVTFDNLVAGQYQFTYIPIANPTQKWEPWNDGVTTNTVTLSQGVVSGVVATIPTLDPAMLGLLALTIASVALWKRRAG